MIVMKKCRGAAGQDFSMKKNAPQARLVKPNAPRPVFLNES